MRRMLLVALLSACASAAIAEHTPKEQLMTAPDGRICVGGNSGLSCWNGARFSRATLLGMYPTEQNHDIKNTILEALFIQDDAHDLIELFRQERDPDMKRKIAEKLSVMDSKEARDFMIDILNK